MSRINVDAPEVLRACREYLERRYNRIHKEQEQAINRKLKRFFFKPTREQAIKELEEDCFSSYNRAIMKGYNNYTVVRDLQSLAAVACKNNVPTVEMDSEEAFILADILLGDYIQKEFGVTNWD